MALRDRKSGRLLPNLLKTWQLDPESAVVAVGFSAGSNSGLRELLRNADDRAQIQGAIALDGAHWNQKKLGTDDPGEYWDWIGEAGPFHEMQMLSARTGKPFILSASAVGRPGPQLSMTREALSAVARTLSAAGFTREDAPPSLSGEITGTDQGRTITRAPVASWRYGGAVTLLYPGDQAADHRWQIAAVAPLALRHLRSEGVI
jgi:hypothetical protein